MVGVKGKWLGQVAVLLGLQLVLLLVSCTGTLAQSLARPRERSQAVRSYADGLERYRAKEYSAAIPLFRRALELEPDFDEAETRLAWSLHQSGQYLDATLHFRQVLVRQPGWPELHDGLGWSRFQVNRYNLALEAFRQALALDPRHRGARVGLAYSLFELGRYAEALPQLERLTGEGEGSASHGLLPDVEEVRARLAWTRFYLGDYTRAREQFLRGLAARPEWAGLHNGLGWTHLRLGDRGQAATSFRRALALRPSFADARDGLDQAES